MSKTFKALTSARSLFLGLVLMATVLVVGATAAAVSYAHLQAQRALEISTANLANTLSLTFESKIDTIDLLLKTCADEISQRIANGQTDAQQITAYLERQMAHLPSVILRATNAQGDVVYEPGPLAAPTNIVDREYFVYLRDHPEGGLFVSKPVVGKINGKWIWLFARRITTKDFQFGGVVFARIDVDDINGLLAQIRLEPGGSIALRGADLGLIAGRVQFAQTYPIPTGDSKVTAEFREAFLTHPGEGTYRTSASVIDQSPRTFSFKSSARYGFVVNIGTTGEIAFGEWRKQAWVAGLLATSFVALMLGFSALISVAWRRQDEGISALQKAQEIAKLGNFRFDLETRTISSSAQLQRLFGIGDEHAESVSPWLHAVVEPDAHALLARAHEVLANGQPFEQEFCIVRPSDGSRRWLHCRGIIECQDNTDPIAVAGTIQDITERKDAEDTVKQFNETLETRIAQRTEELEQAMLKLRSFQQELMKSEARATLSMLVASVSHELSTPIGNSVMVASTLKDQARNFQRVIGSGAIKRREFSDFLSVLDEGTTMIETNLLRTEGLLRTFRQVSADQASEQRRSFDLRQVLLDVLKTLEPSLKRQAHRVVLTVPDGIAMDSLPGPIGQIAINLINNAYLHAFEGRENGQLEVGATVDGSQVILHFSDNGCGMSAQQLEHLFEPFFSTKIGRGGTGLGMAIVENLVSKTLGGHIAVRSVLGEGTRFDIQLPQVLPGAASDGEH